MKRAAILTLAFCLGLAACGGGGGGGSVPGPIMTPASPGAGGSPPPTGTPSPTPAPTPTSTPTASPAPETAPLKITVALPMNELRNYLGSPTVFGVRVLSANGSQSKMVVTQPTVCPSLACTFSVSVPVGTDTLAMTYAAILTGPVSTNNAPLAYSGQVTAQVGTSGGAVGVKLLGVPAFYELDVTNASNWTGTMRLVMRVVDASNSCTPNQSLNGCTLTSFIPGSYADPITVTDTDASGQSGLSVNGAASARTVTVRSSSDTLRLVVKNGADISQAYVTPAASFDAAVFGSPYASQVMTPWTTQDVNGLGFTCSKGNCQTTGPVNITVQ